MLTAAADAAVDVAAVSRSQRAKMAKSLRAGRRLDFDVLLCHASRAFERQLYIYCIYRRGVERDGQPFLRVLLFFSLAYPRTVLGPEGFDATRPQNRWQNLLTSFLAGGCTVTKLREEQNLS